MNLLRCKFTVPFATRYSCFVFDPKEYLHPYKITRNLQRFIHYVSDTKSQYKITIMQCKNMQH